jgi:hypothetical protein
MTVAVGQSVLYLTGADPMPATVTAVHDLETGRVDLLVDRTATGAPPFPVPGVEHESAAGIGAVAWRVS